MSTVLEERDAKTLEEKMRDLLHALNAQKQQCPEQTLEEKGTWQGFLPDKRQENGGGPLHQNGDDDDFEILDCEVVTAPRNSAAAVTVHTSGENAPPLELLVGDLMKKLRENPPVVPNDLPPLPAGALSKEECEKLSFGELVEQLDALLEKKEEKK